MTNDYKVSLPFAALNGWGKDCHAILHTIAQIAGEVRIEVSADENFPINLRIFDDACPCVVPVPELMEEISTAAYRILELVRRDPDTVDFYFSDPDSAVFFKLTWGGSL